MARRFERRAQITDAPGVAKKDQPVGWIGRALLAALAEAKREMPRQALIEAVFGKDATIPQERQVTERLTTLKASGRVTNVRRGWWRSAEDR